MLSESRPLAQNSFMFEFIYDEKDVVFSNELLFEGEFSRPVPRQRVILNGWKLSPFDFQDIGRICSQLLELHIDFCLFSTQSLESIRGLTQIKFLSMRKTVSITRNVAQIFGSWSHLEKLDISENPVESQSFSVISVTCRKLKILWMQACEGLDDICLNRLGEMMLRFRALKQVYLDDCTSFQNEGVLALLQNALNIISLANTKCSTLSIASLRKKNPTLTHLDIQRLEVTSSAFEWIAEGCPHLSYFNCSGCRALDYDSLHMIAKGCPSLQTLDVSSCDRLTDDGIARALLAMDRELR